jgi:hypothetical protein
VCKFFYIYELGKQKAIQGEKYYIKKLIPGVEVSYFPYNMIFYAL